MASTVPLASIVVMEATPTTVHAFPWHADLLPSAAAVP